ncbi:carbon-nitrogen hydrolase family protein [Alicyclobacillus macrosporangiidus]|uniref:carbon-nitrogen hydrolase family protein n=1 Tax=Alicyclobacillus macrosporangiidus TaxID=392015 RepID=UPI0004965F34|nr:carbon-nitrogen hydrolase family protein [Alicyclobacillus macrosporangiidus]
MRVSAVQHHLHTISHFDDFARQVTHYVKAAAEFSAQYVLFPELFTTQLMSIGDSKAEALPIEALPSFTPAYLDLFRGLARDHGMYLIGGTHIIERGGRLYNVAHLFTPDGTVHEQPKLHLTPTEVEEWRIHPGDALQVFETEGGRIAILVCYDIEFPELARMARARGADVLFCPSCTDDKHGFYRVRYCSHARAIEDQVYVITTGTVGALPTVDWMRSNVGQAVVVTPNDLPFPPGGVLAEGEVNQDMIITADLDLELLRRHRDRGSVRTWQDRRPNLYGEIR